jgi:hypothetical protein
MTSDYTLSGKSFTDTKTTDTRVPVTDSLWEDLSSSIASYAFNHNDHTFFAADNSLLATTIHIASPLVFLLTVSTNMTD